MAFLDSSVVLKIYFFPSRFHCHYRCLPVGDVPEYRLLESLQHLEICFVGCCVICQWESAHSREPLPLPSQAGITDSHHPHVAFIWVLGDRISSPHCVGKCSTTEPSPKPWSIFFTEVRGLFLKIIFAHCDDQVFMTFLFVFSTLKLLKEMC